jgi:hypothetical protein
VDDGRQRRRSAFAAALFEYAMCVGFAEGLEGAGRAHNTTNGHKSSRSDDNRLLRYLSLSDPDFGRHWQVLPAVEKSPWSGFQGGSAGSNPVGDTTPFGALTRANASWHGHDVDLEIAPWEQQGPTCFLPVVESRPLKACSGASASASRPSTRAAFQESNDRRSPLCRLRLSNRTRQTPAAAGQVARPLGTEERP